jgi:hypothetical protein
LQGRTDEATALVFNLEKASPLPASYLAIAEALKAIGDQDGARFWTARGLRRFPSDRALRAFGRTL